MPWLVWAIVASGITSAYLYKKSKGPGGKLIEGRRDNGHEPF